MNAGSKTGSPTWATSKSITQRQSGPDEDVLRREVAVDETHSRSRQLLDVGADGTVEARPAAITAGGTDRLAAGRTPRVAEPPRDLGIVAQLAACQAREQGAQPRGDRRVGCARRAGVVLPVPPVGRSAIDDDRAARVVDGANLRGRHPRSSRRRAPSASASVSMRSRFGKPFLGPPEAAAATASRPSRPARVVTARTTFDTPPPSSVSLD